MMKVGGGGNSAREGLDLMPDDEPANDVFYSVHLLNNTINRLSCHYEWKSSQAKASVIP